MRRLRGVEDVAARMEAIDRPVTAQALLAAIAEVGEQRIYFVQVEPCGPIKIGYTGSGSAMASRVVALQVGCPFPLRVTRIFPGDRGVERKLHAVFHPLRMIGEWFWPHPELAAVAYGVAFEDDDEDQT